MNYKPSNFFVLLLCSAAFLFLFSSRSSAQKDCLTFDEQGVNYCNEWINSVSYCFWVKNPPGGHSSPAMCFMDQPFGPSLAISKSDFFKGNWVQKGGCLCFDWMLDLGYAPYPPPTWNVPIIRIWHGPNWDNRTIAAKLVALPNTPDMQEDVWYEICLPIDSCRNGTLPSNSKYAWVLNVIPPGMDSCTAWNTLISNVSGITFAIDYHDSPSEKIFFDNFCWGCKTQQPPPIGLCREIFGQTKPEIEHKCCSFSWNIPLPSQGFSISSITYTVTGGLLDTLYIVGCSYTTSPTNIHNTVSGNLIFSPPCSQQFVIAGEFTPTTSTGHVTVHLCAKLTVPTGQTIECCDSVILKCPRPLITRCDSLSVSPFVWAGLNLSGRTFKIHNLKQPASPIKEVNIQLIPDPNPSSSTFKWNGGGLKVDGGNRPWGVANSGNPYYSKISMACNNTNAPQGLAANNTVEFNLGVDYTLNWTGSVVISVVHCDGDTCFVTYENWCAKPTPKACITSAPTPVTKGVTIVQPSVRSARMLEAKVDSSLVPGSLDLQACNASISTPSKGWSIVGVSVDDGLSREERESGRYRAWNGQTNMQGDWALVNLGCADANKPIKQPWSLRTMLASNQPSPDTPRVNIIFYDADGNPIASDTARVTNQVLTVPVELITPINEENIRVIPNPAANEVKIEFTLQKMSETFLEISDLSGKVLLTDYLGTLQAGLNSFGMSTESLSPGSYFIRITTNNETYVVPLKIVR
ncbi:MAG: T9SS type A sorting domain-containing protein [Ignavibacteria bacterium]|nr:T9SS type A sorting domain-containing protein [Ignavibacteria bacterium]